MRWELVIEEVCLAPGACAWMAHVRMLSVGQRCAQPIVDVPDEMSGCSRVLAHKVDEVVRTGGVELAPHVVGEGEVSRRTPA